MADVVVAGGSEETRLLLRGLLRLHHHRVLSDGAGGVPPITIPADARDPVLVVDADLQAPEWADAIGSALKARPELKVVLLTPTRSGDVVARAKTMGITNVVRRPFAVRELIEAVGPSAPASSTPSP
jgi:DNA-binding NtrC family response regulator